MHRKRGTQVLGREAFCKPAKVACEVAGGIRSANADISNDKAGESPARRKEPRFLSSVNRGRVSHVGEAEARSR